MVTFHWQWEEAYVTLFTFKNYFESSLFGWCILVFDLCVVFLLAIFLQIRPRLFTVCLRFYEHFWDSLLQLPWHVCYVFSYFFWCLEKGHAKLRCDQNKTIAQLWLLFKEKNIFSILGVVKAFSQTAHFLKTITGKFAVLRTMFFMDEKTHWFVVKWTWILI